MVRKYNHSSNTVGFAVVLSSIAALVSFYSVQLDACGSDPPPYVLENCRECMWAMTGILKQPGVSSPIRSRDFWLKAWEVSFMLLSLIDPM